MSISTTEQNPPFHHQASHLSSQIATSGTDCALPAIDPQVLFRSENSGAAVLAHYVPPNCQGPSGLARHDQIDNSEDRTTIVIPYNANQIG